MKKYPPSLAQFHFRGDASVWEVWEILPVRERSLHPLPVPVLGREEVEGGGGGHHPTELQLHDSSPGDGRSQGGQGSP